MSVALQTNTTELLHELLAKRILILDGAMGTVVQMHKLNEAAYRGDRFAAHPAKFELIGMHDVLCLTQPQLIEKIHHDYFEAGADIVETNTFNAQAISLRRYGLSHAAYDINRAAAEAARRAADGFSREAVSKPRFVAGSIGPTDHTIFKSIYFFDPSGHRLELAAWTTTPEQMKRMKEAGPAMIEEWSRTKKPPRHTAWLHEKEFAD